MQENRRLIDMIGRLRAQNQQLNNKFTSLQATKGMTLKEVLEIQKKEFEAQQNAMNAYGASAGAAAERTYEARQQQETTQIGDYLMNAEEAMSGKRKYIEELRNKIAELE